VRRALVARERELASAADATAAVRLEMGERLATLEADVSKANKGAKESAANYYRELDLHAKASRDARAAEAQTDALRAEQVTNEQRAFTTEPLIPPPACQLVGLFPPCLSVCLSLSLSFFLSVYACMAITLVLMLTLTIAPAFLQGRAAADGGRCGRGAAGRACCSGGRARC